ncbi:Gfo/Idh/MocA family oxidoreductase [Gammaproteobacteria bacterium]|jgi:D-galacturonate reductase|nr:Gfo/Idh/MocA family oxidoreductase [Gammaproteobacteria bacterium]MDB4194713.1 Gfo/Idh/MocA family oxidoreductase [Gammaproteobacteria bacterium]MDC0387278.1 Gfo/Idh/MocA family oxidoreductase [Gammaproteobacteria bacterium]
MKQLEIIVIGAGLYVCGKGTSGYGTILPAIFEWKRLNKNLGDIHCVSTSEESSRNLLEKAKELQVKTGVNFEITSYPDQGLKNYTAYREVLNNCKKPACAIIAVPDHLHYQIAKECLEANIHTLIVKPLTPTYAEGLDLVNLAKKNKLHAAVEFHKRWDKSNLILRDKFKSGELGAPLNCWVEYSQRKSVPLSSFKDWASKTTILQYLGVHYIDVIRFVTLASPKRVMAVGQKSEIVRHGIDTYDAIQSVIEWEMQDGTHFTETILTSWVDPNNSSAVSDQKIKFVGTKGRYEADQKERGIRLNTDEHGIQHINPDFCMPYGENDGDIYWQGYGIDSITTFIDDVVAINNEKVNLLDLQNTRPSFKESLISTAVIEAAHISLENDSKWQIIEMDD